jgi:hypothetical protein
MDPLLHAVIPCRTHGRPSYIMKKRVLPFNTARNASPTTHTQLVGRIIPSGLLGRDKLTRPWSTLSPINRTMIANLTVIMATTPAHTSGVVVRWGDNLFVCWATAPLPLHCLSYWANPLSGDKSKERIASPRFYQPLSLASSISNAHSGVWKQKAEREREELAQESPPPLHLPPTPPASSLAATTPAINPKPNIYLWCLWQSSSRPELPLNLPPHPPSFILSCQVPEVLLSQRFS